MAELCMTRKKPIRSPADVEASVAGSLDDLPRRRLPSFETTDRAHALRDRLMVIVLELGGMCLSCARVEVLSAQLQAAWKSKGGGHG